MAYFFGKGANTGFDWGRKRDRGGTGEDDLLGMGQPPFTPTLTPGSVTPFVPVVAETPAADEGVGGYDELLDMLFGKGFETIRGIGGRSRESVYDALAREGMLGTGAMKGVASDVAWQTERGITDLIRNMAQMRSQDEQEAMNLMLTYFGMGQQGWGG